MCTNKIYGSNSSVVNISTANPNLNGSGSLGTVTTASGNGCIVNSITIKATGNTTEGMVRLFISGGGSTTLYKEIYIPANVATGVVNAFQTTIYEPLTLTSGDSLLASTQNAESFNIVANSTVWENCDCVDNALTCCSETRFIAHTGLVSIDTANPNRDGTGSISDIIVGSSASGIGGTMVSSVYIKATASNSQGMIRFYLKSSGGYQLVKEVPIPACTQTSVEPAYRTKALCRIFLRHNQRLAVSTENADSFNVFTYASDWQNCPCLE